MIGFIKEIHERWSLKSRICFAIGFMSGIVVLALCVWDRLAEHGCKADMNWWEYSGVGVVGIVAFICSGLIVGFILFGVSSIPKAISSWMKTRKNMDEWAIYEKRRMREQFIDNCKIVGSTLGVTALITAAVLLLGSLIGYVGWVIFC